MFAALIMFLVLPLATFSMFYPWHLKALKRKVLLHIPLILPPLLCLQVISIHASYNIRPDAALSYLFVMGALMVYAIKICWFVYEFGWRMYFKYFRE